MAIDEFELFKCMVCGNYRLIEQLVEVPVRDFLFKKQICKPCFDKIKFPKESGGTNGSSSKEDPKDIEK